MGCRADDDDDDDYDRPARSESLYRLPSPSLLQHDSNFI